jgi:hypothetical protein
VRARRIADEFLGRFQPGLSRFGHYRRRRVMVEIDHVSEQHTNYCDERYVDIACLKTGMWLRSADL